MTEEYIVNGATGHDDPRDWKASAISGEDIRSIVKNVLKDPQTRLNQWNNDETESSCTIAGSYRQVCQLFDKVANDDEMVTIAKRCNANLGWDFQGQFSSEGANMMAKYWNTNNPDKKVLFINMEYNNQDAIWLEEQMNFLTGVTYRGNSDYGKDYRADGILDGVKFYPSTYGHRTNKLKGFIHDQYYWRTYNKYKLWSDGSHFEQLVKNNVYYPTVYFFFKEEWLKQNTIEQIAKREKVLRYANIFINGCSLFYPNLDSIEQALVSKMVSKYRTKFDINTITDEQLKQLNIMANITKEILSNVAPEKKKDLLNALLTIS